jgi:CelD/BcsL family acetyltransferase involved in cellulose biosynthesis
LRQHRPDVARRTRRVKLLPLSVSDSGQGWCIAPAAAPACDRGTAATAPVADMRIPIAADAAFR